MSGSNGGPSDDKDAEIRRLREELAKAKGQAQAGVTGPSAAKLARKEREARAARIFGKWGRR